MAQATLAPLMPPHVDVAPATVFGEKPALLWLPVKDLRVDETYQRLVTARGLNTIAHIARHFSWSKFQAVIVAPVTGAGLWTIIDGQHRCLAATVCRIREVPCMVVDVQSSEAAKIFAAVNTVAPMTILALFKASRIAGEAWAVEIDRVCKGAGIEPLVYPVSKTKMKPFQTLAIGTIRREIARWGGEIVKAALSSECKRDGASMPGYFDSKTISQAVMRHRGVSPLLPAIPAPHKPLDAPAAAGLDARIEERLRRGHLPSLIAAVLKCPYSDIERVKRRIGL